MQFLLGLNIVLDGAITNILTQDPFPTINCAYAAVQHIEKQKEITSSN